MGDRMINFLKEKVNNNKKIDDMYYDNRDLFMKSTPKVSDKILEKFQNATSEEEAQELYRFFVSSGFCEHGESEQLRYIRYYDTIDNDFEKEAFCNLIQDAKDCTSNERNERIEKHFSTLITKIAQESSDDRFMDKSLYDISVLELSDEEFAEYLNLSSHALDEQMCQMNLFLVKNYNKDKEQLSLRRRMRVASKVSIMLKVTDQLYNKIGNTRETADTDSLNVTAMYYRLLFNSEIHKELLDSFDVELQQAIQTEINRPNVLNEINHGIDEENITKVKGTISGGVETGKKFFKRFRKATNAFVETMTKDDEK